MRSNYNSDSSGRKRYQKRQNNNRRPPSGGNNRRGGGGRRNGRHSGGINIERVSALRNKYLDMAKEELSNGNRVEAENYYQHAEHYNKLISEALAARKEHDYYDDSSRSKGYSNNYSEEDYNSSNQSSYSKNEDQPKEKPENHTDF